jgi:hypothetical protein
LLTLQHKYVLQIIYSTTSEKSFTQMKRPDDMSFELFQQMRRDINKKLKQYKKGKLIFASSKDVEVLDQKTGKKHKIKLGQTAKKKTK